MAIQLISVASDGTQANELSFGADVSADGRVIGLLTGADNLDPSDTNGKFDAYVRNLTAGTTEAVSVGDMGQFPVYGNVITGFPQPYLSGDGRFVAFDVFPGNLVSSDGNNANDVFVRDRLLDTTTRITTDDTPRFGGDSILNRLTDISDDGRKVVFGTGSTNYLMPDANGAEDDVFVADRDAGIFELVSVDPDGNQFVEGAFGNSVSGDSNVVGFTGIVPDPSRPDLTVFRYFLRDVDQDVTIPLPAGDAIDLTFDGGLALIRNQSDAMSGPLLLFDRATRAVTDLLSASDDDVGGGGAISGDGNIVAFSTGDAGLVPDDTNNVADVFILDRVQDRVVRVSLDESGREAQGYSSEPDLSFDGRTIAFRSEAALTADDATEGGFSASDVYVVTLDAVAVADAASATAGTPTTLDVLANDYDLDGDALALTGFTTPAGASVTRDDNGTVGDLSDDRLTITADAAYRGPLSLTYTIEDAAGNEGRAAVDLFVRGPGGADAFPNLVEKEAVDPSLINGVDPDLLTGDGTSEFVVSFVSEVARFENSLGTYTVAEDDNIDAVEFLFTNVDSAAPGDEVSLGVPDAGERFNLFVLQDGFGQNDVISSGDIEDDAYSLFFSDPLTFERASVTSGDPSLRYIFFDGDTVLNEGLSGDVLHAASYVDDAGRNPLNTGGELQALSGFDTDGRLLIGFEDKTRAGGGSDDDFNDVVVAIEKRDPTTGATIAFGDSDAMFG